MPFIHLRSQLTTAATPHLHAEQPQQPTMHRHHHNAYTQQSSHALNTRPNHPSDHSSHHNPGQTPRTVQTDQYPTSSPKNSQPAKYQNTYPKRTKSSSPVKDQRPAPLPRNKPLTSRYPAISYSRPTASVLPITHLIQNPPTKPKWR